jgi:DHA2 family multidrug resistance protein
MPRESKLIVFVAVLASLLEIIDTSIVNVALPTMMGNLGATLEDISMVITGYAIANAIVLPLSAWLGERMGRRKYYLGCIGLFILTSVACGLAPNLLSLIIFRILQGLAGGALLPTSQTLIYEQFPKEKAGVAGAVFGMSVMVGPALGPVMGGYLTDNFGWRMIFNINLPLGILALLIGLAVIFDQPNTGKANKEKPPLDTLGFALLVVGVGCLQFVLERGEAEDWFDSRVIMANALIAAIALPVFVWWELRAEHPIINIRLIKDSAVHNGIAIMGFLGFFLYGLVFMLPVFLSLTYHYDATQIGLFFIPGSLLTMFMMPIIGRLMQGGTNPKLLILTGFILIELCLLTMTQFSPLSPQSEILRMLYIRGLALSFLFVPINSSILSQYSGYAMGQVAGLLNLFRQIGGSMGIAAVATMIKTRGYQNYADLAANVTALRPASQNFFNSTAESLRGKMVENFGMGAPSTGAVKILWAKVQAQVFMQSFLQLVTIIMIIMSFTVFPIWLLKLKKGPVKIVDAH